MWVGGGGSKKIWHLVLPYYQCILRNFTAGIENTTKCFDTFLCVCVCVGGGGGGAKGILRFSAAPVIMYH